VTLWAEFMGARSAQLRAPILEALRDEGIEVSERRARVVDSGLVVFDSASKAVCELVFRMSGGGGARVIALASAAEPLRTPESWGLIDAGAADVLVWDDPRRCASEIAARLRRWAQVDEILASNTVRGRLVGEGGAWRSLLRHVIEVACFTDAPVLLTGESGTGKELVARLVHDLDPRPRKAKLVVVDCTTIVPTLSGSEFFGHERGSFTGATTSRDGAFALADGGTLFLDEVGELPLTLQAELLRVVQEGVFKRVGSNTWLETSFRLVCATNRDLRADTADGRFRADLYYRLAGATFRLPPLRERLSDVPLFIRHFLGEGLPEDEEVPELDGAVRDHLLAREYPGNVRDLRQLVTRIRYRHVGPGPVTLGDLPPEERRLLHVDDWRAGELETAVRRALAHGATLKEIGSAAIAEAVRLALEDEGGSTQRAARRLGVTARALQLRRAAGGPRILAPYTPETDDDTGRASSTGN
jgi:transcriptional regulator with GAF, ATPase, and Fis domain